MAVFGVVVYCTVMFCGGEGIPFATTYNSLGPSSMSAGTSNVVETRAPSGHTHGAVTVRLTVEDMSGGVVYDPYQGIIGRINAQTLLVPEDGGSL
jgi:hypothetical protein